MTATGSPSHERRDRTAGLRSLVGEPLMTRPPVFSLHRFHPLRITNWANTDGADMKSYEFVRINSSDIFTNQLPAANRTQSSRSEVLRTITYWLKSNEIP